MARTLRDVGPMFIFCFSLVAPAQNTSMPHIWVRLKQMVEPYWQDNPEILSAVEVAALIFGGSSSDKFVLTNSNITDSSTITHAPWASVWGVSNCIEVAEDYSLNLGASC